MILYIKQKVFSIGDKYNVYNENLEPVYEVESEILTFLSKIHLYDLCGNELFYIKKNFTLFLSQYEIYKGNTLCATVEQEFSFLKSKLNVNSSYGNFTIDGDFLSMNFTIYCNGTLFGTIEKEWLSWGDTYKLTFTSPDNAAFFVSLVIAIDNCLHNNSNKHHNN